MYNRPIMFEELSLGWRTRGLPINGDVDPFSAKFLEKAFRGPDDFRQGWVMTYNPNTHSASVAVQGCVTPWTCVFSDEMLSYSYGYSECNPPREGELVLVMQINEIADAGIIIGRIPYPLRYEKDKDLYNDPDEYHRRLYTQLKGTWDKDIPCFMAPLRNRYDDSTQTATHFRPTDVYPGEFAKLNQHNCGIKGGMFSTTLLGGGASLRMSALSNLARLTCESYQRISLSGSVNEFHNGRYLSTERDYTIYQEERLGGDSPKAKVWTSDSEAPVKGERQAMRSRIKDMTGFFGNLSARFFMRPDSGSDSDGVRSMGDGDHAEQGVSRETVDPSGQYRLSSAGMIAIERTGRIPVPVRNCFPTDKGHDFKDKDPERLEPFEHKQGDPSYRQLELFDRQAYDLKNQYSRVDGLGLDRSDYDVPQEEDLSPLDDEYDREFFQNETVKLSKFDRRRAGVYIGEDGSVIVRDAWGSEIVMIGGNIQLSCAGNVMVLPGMTALTIAGDDIVQKAQNSIDIHASRHDVRLSAARNMEILGGSTENGPGGVVVEARGSSNGPWDGEGKGESARTSGITLKTNRQSVVVDASNVVIRSKKDTRIVSGDEKIDGNVSIGAKNVRTRAKNVISATDGAAVSINGSSITTVGKSIGIYAEKSVNMRQDKKAPAIQWQDAGQNFASEILPAQVETTGDLADEKTASGPFSREALDKMSFGFRTSEECGTGIPWTIGDTESDGLRLYEPAWAQVMNVFETLKGKIEKAFYEEEDDWGNGSPWPGSEAGEYAQYAMLEGTKPDNLTENGFNESRKSVKKKSSITVKKLHGNYIVRKTES